MNTMADNNVQHTKTTLIKNLAITMWSITGINKKASELLSNLKNKKIYVSNFCNKNKSSRINIRAFELVKIWAQLQVWVQH